jgi:hypothetical protein
VTYFISDKGDNGMRSDSEKVGGRACCGSVEEGRHVRKKNENGLVSLIYLKKRCHKR